jgi:hypothetical protein
MHAYFFVTEGLCAPKAGEIIASVGPSLIIITLNDVAFGAAVIV